MRRLLALALILAALPAAGQVSVNGSGGVVVNGVLNAVMATTGTFTTLDVGTVTASSVSADVFSGAVTAGATTQRSGSANYPGCDLGDHYVVPVNVSGTSHWAGFPGVVRRTNGDLLMLYAYGVGNLSPNTTGHQVYQTTSADGGVTWTTPVLVLDAGDDHGSEVNGLVRLTTGHLVAIGWHEDNSYYSHGAYVIRSIDEGATWTEVTTLDTGAVNKGDMGMGIAVLADGSLLAALQTYPSRTTYSIIQVRRSTDEGLTWGSPVVVWDGATDSHDYFAPKLLQLANGTVLLTVYDYTGSAMKYATSTDSGATWSALGAGPAGFGVYNSGLAQLSTGRVLAFGAISPTSASISVSDNNGATWSAAIPIETKDSGVFQGGSIVALEGDLVFAAWGQRVASSIYGDIRAKYLFPSGVSPLGGAVFRSLSVLDGDVLIGQSATGINSTGTATIDRTQRVTIESSVATQVPLVVRGAASQSASMQSWTTSTGTQLAAITSTGGLTFGDTGAIASSNGNVSISSGSGVNSYNGIRSDTSFTLRNPAATSSAVHSRLVEEVTVAAAAYTDTTIQLPANSVIEAVVGRVTVLIPTAATVEVGDPTTASRFATGVAVAAGTTFVGLLHRNPDVAAAAGPVQTVAASVRITPNATPADNSGRIKLVIYYTQFTAPTS